MKEICLPCFGITVCLYGDPSDESQVSGTIISALHESGGCRSSMQSDAAIDALESIILAHACAGIDITSPAYVEGVETAVDAVGNAAH